MVFIVRRYCAICLKGAIECLHKNVRLSVDKGGVNLITVISFGDQSIVVVFTVYVYLIFYLSFIPRFAGRR